MKTPPERFQTKNSETLQVSSIRFPVFNKIVRCGPLPMIRFRKHGTGGQSYSHCQPTYAHNMLKSRAKGI